MSTETVAAESRISPPDGIAVVGLGKMGLPMARHLRDAGFRVVGFDPSQACQDKAAELGIEVAVSPADAAAKTAAALVVVGFDDQAIDVISDADQCLLAGASDGSSSRCAAPSR